jgi:cyclopropane fatty-acyl-phospholipid synthase-like methyltransferase
VLLRQHLRRFKSLRYQLRYVSGPDPETLIAADVAEALGQARQRSYLAQSDVFLWRDGLMVAQCSVPVSENESVMSEDLRHRLATAGFYLMNYNASVGKQEDA